MSNKHLKGKMNQLANSKNPYQGEAKRILTVCSAGLLRSPTTAIVLYDEYGYNCRAAGIVEEYALIPVSEALIYWADEIVFMEDNHFIDFQAIWKDNNIAKTVIENKEYQILNIPDCHAWNEEELRQAIVDTYKV